MTSNVPNVIRQEVAVNPWHLFSLETHFEVKKAASKPQKMPFNLRSIVKSTTSLGPTRHQCHPAGQVQRLVRRDRPTPAEAPGTP